MKLHCREARIGGRGVDHSTCVIFGNSLVVYLLPAPPFPVAGGRPAACRSALLPGHPARAPPAVALARSPSRAALCLLSRGKPSALIPNSRLPRQLERISWSNLLQRVET